MSGSYFMLLEPAQGFNWSDKMLLVSVYPEGERNEISGAQNVILSAAGSESAFFVYEKASKVMRREGKH